jgi:hypothetical protein
MATECVAGCTSRGWLHNSQRMHRSRRAAKIAANAQFAAY